MDENRNEFEEQGIPATEENRFRSPDFTPDAEPEYTEEVVSSARPKSNRSASNAAENTHPSTANRAESVKPSEKKSNTPIIIGVVLAAVVILVVGAFMLLGGGNGGNGGGGFLGGIFGGGGNGEPEHTHSFGKWKTVTGATCESEGSQERKCDCGEIETKPLPRTDNHDFGEWETVDEATCTENGKKERECEICGEVDSKKISASGEHDYVDNGRVDATCTSDGSTSSRICRSCGDLVLTGYTLASPGHQESNWIVDSQPSADFEGTRHKECTVCGETTVTESIPFASIEDFNIEYYGDGTCGIMDYFGSDSCVVIPAYANGYAVDRIEAYAFSYKEHVETVIIPDGVRTIDDYAFQGCSNLTSVSMPDSVTHIGQFAFYFCTSLSEVNLPKDLLTMEYAAFAFCYSLKSVEIPDSVGSLYYAFYECNKLKSVTLPKDITIYEGSFDCCYSLADIYYDGSAEDWENVYVDSMGNYYLLNATFHFSEDAGDTPNTEGLSFRAYGDCWEVGYDQLSNCYSSKIVIPAVYEGRPVIRIANGGFQDCDWITDVVLPDTVTTIGYGGFESCTSLSNINLEGVDTIGDCAFYGCSSLTRVDLSASVEYVGHLAFCECELLLEINVPYGNYDYKSVYGVLYNYSGTELICYPPAREDNTFNVPEGVTNIYTRAFDGAQNLITVYISSTVDYIGFNAFGGCSSLHTIDVNSQNDYYTDIDGVVYDAAVATLIIYPIGKSDSLFVVPDSVTEIGDFSCYQARFAAVTLHEGISYIGDSAFASSAIRSIMIPEGVSYIGEYAFSGCNGLTFITLPNGIGSINPYTFSDCVNLESVVIPDSVYCIGEGAFFGCAGLKQVFHTGSWASWYGVDIQDKNIPIQMATITCDYYSEYIPGN
ncbi:MAG: leucine-rich repeat domain-containing protein [Clostridia bacterium]|nr:leucine-rich repeat domain-containing protein [Clostridia bacterium]